MKTPTPKKDGPGRTPKTASAPEEIAPLPQSGAKDVLPIAEETARVDKRETVTGRVRIQTVVDTVEEMARAVLRTDAVEVTRVPVGRVVNAPPEIRTESDVMIVPVLEEVLVVEKRLVLKEELHVRRRTSTEEVEVPVSLRKQRAVVERIDPEQAPGKDAE